MTSALVELLLYSDADGFADTREDRNGNGAADTGESNRLVADSDADTFTNGFDNCALVANNNQLDTNGDGFGNLCDADLDNNGFTNFSDLSLFKQRFATSDPDANLDGIGIINFSDLAIFKALFGKPLGPSGVVP